MPDLEPLRWSNLRNMARSPAHYLWALSRGVTQTPAMRLGWLAHARTFNTGGYSVWEGDRRGKAWNEYKADHGTENVVTAAEILTADAIALAVKSDPVAAPLLEGITEERIAWKIGDRECSGTPDVRTAHVLVDLKTTADASPNRFPSYAMRAAYLAQMAWYSDGLDEGNYPVPGRICIVAVESKPPYAVCVYELTERAIDMGRRTWSLLFNQLMACEAADAWPGYSQTPVFIDAPEDSFITIDGEEISL